MNTTEIYGPPSPRELVAYVGMPTDNASYLSCMKSCPVPQAPMSSSTVGILMILSTFQYQAPHMGPYSNAASQAGKAAFIESGEQNISNTLSSRAETAAKNAYRSVGLTDIEVGAVLGAAKVVRDKQVDVNGPNVYFVKTHLTVGQDHGSLGLGVNF
jgi:hypothetical protein